MDKAGFRRPIRDFGMRSRWRLMGVTVALALGGAFLTSGPGTGCAAYLAESALVTTDFCFILDCQNGFLGGTIDPCTDEPAPNNPAVFPGGPLFTDCP